MIDIINENRFRFFRAKVIDNIDPDKLNRVKVFIPELMYDLDEKKDGLWALPANQLFGGNNDQDFLDRYAGSCIVPNIGSWVWIFFEDDNPNRPFYITGVSLKNQPKIPESQSGKQYWNKWILFRSPQGRSLWISDDDETPDSRVILTGKKRKFIKDQDVFNSIYKIVGNQSVIMIEEDITERIILCDYKKNYLSIRSDDNNLYMYAVSDDTKKGKIHIFNDKTLIRLIDDGDQGTVHIQNSSCIITINGKKIYIDAPDEISITVQNAEVKISKDNIKLQTSGSLIDLNGGNITIFASAKITLQAPLIEENPGVSASPSPDSVRNVQSVDHDNID